MTSTDFRTTIFTVIGVLVAAIITGGVSVWIARKSADDRQNSLKEQLDHATQSLKQQLDHSSQEATREQRRAVYSQFLVSKMNWDIHKIKVHDFVERVVSLQAESSEKSLYTPLNWNVVQLDENYRKLKEEIDRRHEILLVEWAESLSRVQLVSSLKVYDLAKFIFNQASVDANDLWNHTNNSIAEEARILPITMIAAMREDVGVFDNFKIGPETGRPEKE